MKGLALLSGGLDSALAIRVATEAGAELSALHFTGPFTCGEPEASIDRVEGLADQLGVELIIHHLGQEFLDLITRPRFGYGRGMNPCVDCRIYELGLARTHMEQIGASYLVTGEVVGQRPMSQRLPTLNKIEREAGVADIVLRPLSALLLPATLPERAGAVDRSKLLDISGRSRRRQFALAREFGLEGYGSPAGGCLLTSREFTRRLEDLLDHAGRLTEREVGLLKSGRVFRLSPDARMIVGRNLSENLRLEQLAVPSDILARPELPGPLAVIIGPGGERVLETAASVILRYINHNEETSPTITFRRGDTVIANISTKSANPETLDQYRV